MQCVCVCMCGGEAADAVRLVVVCLFGAIRAFVSYSGWHTEEDGGNAVGAFVCNSDGRVECVAGVGGAGGLPPLPPPWWWCAGCCIC